MITLTLDLPKGIEFVCIYAKHHGGWSITLRDHAYEVYASAEAPSVMEAYGQAMTILTAKRHMIDERKKTELDLAAIGL